MAWMLISVLLALSGLHLYWAAGGRWPGTDDLSFIAMTIGRTPKMKPPGPLVCTTVAAALAVTAGLVAAKAGLLSAGPIPSSLVAIGFWGAGMVFLARGIAGYVPAVTRYAEGTPFYRLNRLIYSPLCLLIALGFLVTGLAS